MRGWRVASKGAFQAALPGGAHPVACRFQLNPNLVRLLLNILPALREVFCRVCQPGGCLGQAAPR